MRETTRAPEGSDGTRIAPDIWGPSGHDDTRIRAFLIADVRGYTAFTQERGDEAATALVARFAEIVGDTVEAHDGSLIELRGDEALVCFVSPRQAIRAAVALQSSLLEQTRADPTLPLPVGIGIDVGEAVALGDGYRGGALNLAARLCGEAGPGEILGSQSVVHLARTVEGISYLDRGEIQPKGLSEPVRVLAIASEVEDVAGQMAQLMPAPPVGRASSRRLQFRILGPIVVGRGDETLSIGGPKQRAVLAHLLLRANEPISADALVEAVWGLEASETARNTLYTYISHLRAALGQDRILSQAPGYRLRLDPAELDAARFDQLLRDAEKAKAINPRIAATVLDEALGLWRGPALADVAEAGALIAEATRLDELRLIASEERIDALLDIGEHARVIPEAEALVERYPLRERIWQQLMLALYREGRQAEALNAFQRVREILADELGIDPSPDLARLHERILRHDPALELRGEPLRGYRLLEKIDEGPTGVVFRAIQPHVGREVAVKIFHEHLASDPSFARRFEQDAQAIATLEHPHIVPIYDYWREPGRAYLVSRYLKGGSLAGLETRGEEQERDREVLVIEQVAAALSFAHARQIAHGNVGASNVLFDGEGNAYLADFRVGGANPDATEDTRELATLVRDLLGTEMPRPLSDLVQRASVGEDAPRVDELLAALRDETPRTAAAPAEAVVRNPYKGLRAFTEADAGDFFGRSELTSRLLSRLRKSGTGSRFVAVVGPSGGGKSSVVRAGVVPAIRQGALGDPDGVFVAEMFPGTHPLDELEAALLRVATHSTSRLRDLLDEGSRGLLDAMDLVIPAPAELVLVVDQFEEVFTLVTDEHERELFLESLRVATADPEGRLRVIVTLRADFYDRPLVYPRFGDRLAAGTDVVAPLTPDETEQAIRRPAEGVGLGVEPGLVAEIVADVAHQPGALPLLQYALTELFERRDDDRLTLAAYREIGGVAGALSARADRIFASTGPEAQRTVKQVFLRLVTLGEGREDTRRRVARSELDALEVDTKLVDLVVDTYGRHRLLTFDREPATREPTVEIAHEALLGAWERFRTWIDDARDDLRQDRRLARAAGEWRGSDRDPSFLLRGARLVQVETWAGATDLAIGKAQREYLKASLDQRDRELVEEEVRLARERRTERRSRARLRALVAVLSVAALVAGGLAIVATEQSQRASRAASIATARQLAAAALTNLEVDPELSILLAIEAVKETRAVDGMVRSEAEEALHRAVVGSRIERSVPGIGGRVDWSPHGVFVTEGPQDTGVIDIRHAETGESVLQFHGHDGDVTDVAFSPDGSMLATTGDDGMLKVWDPSSGDLLAIARGKGAVWGPSFSGDGSVVAAAWYEEGGLVRVLDLTTGRINLITGVPGLFDTALSPDGRKVAAATGGETDHVYVFEVASGERLLRLGRGQVDVVSWSPDGRYVTGVDSGWDATTGRLAFTLFGHPSGISDVDWSSDSARVVTGGWDGTAKVWEIAEGGARELMSLSAPPTKVSGVAFSPDGTRVLTGNTEELDRYGEISGARIWDVSPSGDEEWANLPGSWPPATFMPTGHDVLASGTTASVNLFDPEASREARLIGSYGRRWGATVIDVSADGATLAIGYHDYKVSVRDVATGQELFDVDTGSGPQPAFPGIDLSPDGEYVALSDHGAVRVLDRSGRTVRSLSKGTPFFVGPHGRLLATAEADRVRIWDWRRGEVLTTVHAGSEEQVVLDPTGTLIAMVVGGRVEVWDVNSGDLVVSPPRQPGDIYDLAFSQDGSLIATGASDGTVRLFDAESGQLRLTLRGPTGAGLRISVWGVAFSVDGSMLASSHGDGTVRVWALDIDDLLEIAGRNVTRSLTDEECRQYLHEACPGRSSLAGSVPA